VGLLAAILGMLLTLVFRAASERNAQAAWGGAVAAAPILSAPQVDPATPRFLTEVAAEGTDDDLLLGISVRGPHEVVSAAAIEIIGLPGGWTLSAGRPFGEMGWRIPAEKLSSAVILPPRGFAGAIDLVVELRLADDTLVERRSVRLRRARIGKAREPQPHQPIEPVRFMASESPSTSVSSKEHNVSEKVTSTIHEPDPEQIALLLKVAEGFLAAGDLSAARTSLRRAAKAGNARAALLLGETYDPGWLDRFGIRGSHADPTMARTWYDVAREFGSPDAHRQLDQLSRVKQLGDLPSRP
jgi:hypothetical protein